ncbi:putative lipid-transfer protein DIR1 [Ziziphus jujuba]|uniref:Lipid-transfer protein DIR1 n=1 Tax=Ziziphus jujuba TaxID=326968 RepID=A0A6P4AUH6_ZIZJJ|nr:putative lipid-transfer protein DIR1 [Ziziphus jujuba]
MEMANKKLGMVTALLLGILVMALVANGEQSICNMSKEGFKSCEPSVTGQNPPPPSAACCSALSKADMQCLCLFKNSRLLGLYGIDPNVAMQLPDKCNLGQSFHC